MADCLTICQLASCMLLSSGFLKIIVHYSATRIFHAIPLCVVSIVPSIHVVTSVHYQNIRRVDYTIL